MARLTKRLEDNLGLAEEAAQWAVEYWAFALGVTEEETDIEPLSPPPPVPTYLSILQKG
ncbi:hypothetical protein [Geminocystis sp. GBBB08]|uniref:hypothetical protein n=1 Tax=Geminocystis sp. GBBB08 TaxID=2604140 RepID=UPI0027E22BEE|nr:hypothetical protein [Geminocystis sp. GBBB08]